VIHDTGLYHSVMIQITVYF